MRNIYLRISFFVFFILIFLILPPIFNKIHATVVCGIQKGMCDEVGSNSDGCTFDHFDYYCNFAGICIWPFCTKYTGYECASHNQSNDPDSPLPPGTYCRPDGVNMFGCASPLIRFFVSFCHDIPDNCNWDVQCSGTCNADSPNACSTFSGTQGECNFTTYNGSTRCTQVPAPNQKCTPVCYGETLCIQGFCVTPTPTSTPTPTPIVSISGSNIDSSGNPLTLPGQKVTLTGGTTAERTSSSWNFSVYAGTYTVTAAPIAGYINSYSLCENCYNHPASSYVPGNSVSNLYLPTNGNYADIYFKYAPSSCSVTTSPSTLTLLLGGEQGIFTVTGVTGQGSATINKVDFYVGDSTIASIDPISALSIPSSTAVTSRNRVGETAVWARVFLSDARICDPPRATNVYVVSAITPTPTPTGTPSCQVRTSPSSLTLPVGGTGAITATVENLPAGRTVSKIRFGSYNTSFATVNPTDDYYSPYSTAVTAVASGSTAVWATADLNDGTFCQASGTMDTDITVPTSTPTPTVSPTPCVTYAPPFSISGKVFDDENGDTLVSTGEPNYTGAITITNSRSSTSYPVIQNGDGTYISSGLSTPGDYTIAFSEPLTTGYWFSYPPLSFVDGEHSLAVTVGSCCNPVPSEGICANGSISNLNAGVTNTALQWIQSQGSDLRWDSGFNNSLPPATNPANKKSTSIPLPGGNTPGIIFSGNKTPTFGGGQASSTGWQVGSPTHPDLFTDTHSVIPTSYKFLLETANSSGITPANLLSYCGSGGISNCTLSSSLPHGIYKADGNLTIVNTTNYNFSAGNFIILVDGNLNINPGVNAKIKVPVGSTAIFSAKGDITINRNVGAASPASSASDIEGLYSADGNFYTTDANNVSNCSTEAAAKRLNIAGSVIANAGRSGGTFVNKRTLCASNASYPSVSFIARPDFMLNYPSMVRQIPRTWQDVAP